MDNLTLKLASSVTDWDMGEGWSVAWNPASPAHEVPLSLAFCGSKCKVRVWDIITPSIWQMRFEGQKYSSRSLAWSSCGKLLAATWTLDMTSIFENKKDQAIELFSFYGAHDLKGEMQKNSVSWSACGSLLATCGSKENSIGIWKIKTDTIASRPLLAKTGSVLAAFASNDEGCFYKQVKHDNCAPTSRLPEDRLPFCAWNIESNDDELELVAYLRGHAGDVNCVQWHPKTDTLFSCSSDKTIKVWMDNNQDGNNNWNCVQTLGQPQNGHVSTVWSLSFNAGGDKMVSCSDHGALKVWKTENIGEEAGNRFANWRHLYTISGCHDGAIYSVHWSREGIIATGGADGTIGLFGENNESQVGGHLYKLLRKVNAAHDNKVNSVQWSPGENRLLASTSADETIKVWELGQTNEVQIKQNGFLRSIPKAFQENGHASSGSKKRKDIH